MKVSVSLASVSDAVDNYALLLVINHVENPPVANAKAAKTLEFFREGCQLVVDDLVCVFGKPFDFSDYP